MKAYSRTQAKHFGFQATERDGEITLVLGGGGTYLWIGPKRGKAGVVYTFTGKPELLQLARAILKEFRAERTKEGAE